jgi:predicted Zn finger-like uncharacterized protein
MSLITRCPECGTMFKVVADQLKVSQGWVRCGHCAEVFDASAYLLPDDALALAPFILTADVAAEVEPAALPLPSHGEPESEALHYRLETPQAPASSHDEQAPDRLPLMAPQAEQEVAQERADALLHRASWKQERQEYPYMSSQEGDIDVPPRLPELVHTPSVDDSGIGRPDVADAKAGDADVAPIGVVNADTQEDVSFVRDAQRKAFWKNPLVRWSMRMMSVLLLVALAFQWTLHNKDTLAALQPQLAPLLRVLCAVPRCEVQLPRRIESVVIDSSSFNRLGPDLYRLSFALRNTGAIPLALPSLEVTLTDARDQALLRRVLAPAQYGTGTGALAAHSALTGAFLMKISDEGQPVNVPSPVSSIPSLPSVAVRVAGYRILAFYP